MQKIWAKPFKPVIINHMYQACYKYNQMLGPHKYLGKIYVNWLFKLTNWVLISLDIIFSRIEWQSISIFFIFSWKTRFELIWKVVWLSHISVIWVTFPNWNSLSNYLSQISSQVAEVITLYSASALDFTATFCFLLFRDIKLSPTETQYPKVNLLLEGDNRRSCPNGIWITYNFSMIIVSI